ncbi:DoxX family protein [Edaphobacter paludis]|uniref:DoxX family protein n=1 Tax=Edaphobacter paludis TaxID=3035702 RepID=A0AAU7D788_9BACT
MSTFHQDSSSRLSWGILLVRILVGWVFLSEGIQKFLFPAALGTGRFAKIGIPWPQFSAPFIGIVEIVCGTFLLLGLFTSLASVLLLIDIAVAIATTKLPMLLKQGLWATLHEGRTDFSMLFGLVAILMLGAGMFSFDWRRNRPAKI